MELFLAIATISLFLGGTACIADRFAAEVFR